MLGLRVYPADERTDLPDISGTTLAGTKLALRSLTGHGIVVVNVWASWCRECKGESRDLAALARTLPSQQVSFVGIDEQDTTSKATDFARSIGMTYPQLVDSDGSLLSRLSVLPTFGIPSTLIVDGHGKMAARIVGPVKRAELTQVIARIQSGA